jgi:hypothetical protein
VAQPGSQDVGGPLVHQIDRSMGVQINEQRAVASAPAAQRHISTPRTRGVGRA